MADLVDDFDIPQCTVHDTSAHPFPAGNGAAVAQLIAESSLEIVDERKRRDRARFDK
jgi:hypothetical protein